MSTEVDRQEAEGNAVEAPVADETLAALKTLVDDIRSEIATNVQARRETARDTRLCRWDGQSDDGRKHREDLGRDASPWENASDARVRLADKIVNERVAELVTAMHRGTARITAGTDALDAEKAARLEILRRWLLNQWGDEFRRQMQLVAQYQEGDAPGVGLALVEWEEEWGLEPRTLTREDVLNLWAERQQSETGQAPTDADLQAVQWALADPNTVKQAAGLLLYVAPEAGEEEAARAAKELTAKGTARLAVRYLRKAAPRVTALRLYEDVFIQANTRDLQRTQIVILREWLTRAEVLERSKRERWAKDFVEELIGQSHEDTKTPRGSGEGFGHEGESGLDPAGTAGELDLDGATLLKRRGLYEVLTSLERAATPGGAIGIFVRKWSYFCQAAALPRRLYDRKHGRYPLVAFASEAISPRLIDSRGVPERAQTEQAALKQLRDSFLDHVDRNVNPPLLKPRGTKYSLQKHFAPNGEIEVGLRDRLEWMKAADYPRAAVDMLRETQRQANDYFGRSDPEVAEDVVLTLRQMRVDSFLSCVAEVEKLALQLCQQFMPPEKLARILGQRGASEIPTSLEEIQGQFDVLIFTDVRDWDPEQTCKKAKMLLDSVRPMDVRGTLPWEAFAAAVVASVDPRLAELIPREVAGEDRVRQDEEAAYGKILLGLRPPMPDWIENPQMRLQVLSDLHRPRLEQPGAFAPVPAASLALLDERVKYLQFQQTQMDNAATGRRGVKEEPVGDLVAEASGKAEGGGEAEPQRP